MRKIFFVLLAFILFPFSFSNRVYSESDSVFGNKLDAAKEAREQYMSRFKDALDSYKETRNTYREVSEDQAEEARRLVLERAKNVLMKRLDFAKGHLDGMLFRIKASSLSDEDKKAVEDLAAEFNETLDGYKNRIREADSIEELRDIVRDLNQDIRKMIADLRGAASSFRISRLEGIADRFEERAKIVKKHIDAAASAGHDVSDVQVIYDEALESLETAQDTYSEAMDLIKDGMVSEGHSLLVSANGYVREAHEGFKEVIRILKGFYREAPWEVS